LINTWLALGGTAYGIQEGSDYLDVGTIDGFHVAFSKLMRGYPPIGTVKPTE